MAPPPFFRLPRELRDRSYHLALIGGRARFYVDDIEPIVGYISDRSEDFNLGWLFTSRLILAEGLDQLCRHAKLQSYYITRNLTRKRYTVKRMFDGFTSVFVMGRIKTVQLHLQMGTDWRIKNVGWLFDQLIVPKSKETSRRRKETGFTELRKVIKDMKDCAFEKLELTVYLFETDRDGKMKEEVDDDQEYGSDDSYRYLYVPGYHLTAPWKVEGYLVDFNFLKNLGTQWKHIEIEYIPTYMQSRYDDGGVLSANIIAVPVIQECLAEIGKELVGGEGWAIRDSTEDLRRRPTPTRNWTILD